MSRGFAFKQFTIHDDRCQMKVGTDGVLLGAWADVTNARHILDIGTGSGLIALMLAQRNTTAIIDGVEILEVDARQAVENAARSPWPNRIAVHNTSIQTFEPKTRYDLIVSNPPYFTKSQLPTLRGRASVRHTLSLSHDELIVAAAKLLQPTGALTVILPPATRDEFIKEAEKNGLYTSRQLSFQTRPARPIERYLLEFRKHPRPVQPESMCLYAGAFADASNDPWSPEYRALVGDFYL
jgi:tRNA1Val (adenine37-N6)-methyltransferase